MAPGSSEVILDNGHSLSCVEMFGPGRMASMIEWLLTMAGSSVNEGSYFLSLLLVEITDYPLPEWGWS